MCERTFASLSMMCVALPHVICSRPALRASCMRCALCVHCMLHVRCMRYVRASECCAVLLACGHRHAFGRELDQCVHQVYAQSHQHLLAHVHACVGNQVHMHMSARTCPPSLSPRNCLSHICLKMKLPKYLCWCVRAGSAQCAPAAHAFAYARPYARAYVRACACNNACRACVCI